MDGPQQEALYQELIMQRAREPRHAGIVQPADAAAEGSNPFCGDSVRVSLALSPQGRPTQVLHQTRGCAICTASADLMAEAVQQLDPGAIRSLFERFDAMLQGKSAGSGPPRLGLLDAFENLYEYRSRIRCATLPWAALLDALESERTR